jgi:hypothetical protein
MIPIHNLIGRLSNQMFITAAHYARCQETGEHFFVQDEKYFEKYKEQIKNLFSAGINRNSIDRVAIHRRLTDYVGNSFYVDLGHHEHEKLEDNYFVRAMSEFPNAKFLVFSDDVETAKKEPMFQGDRFEFPNGSEIEDMNMMASCKGIIGSNSSFSWWGAYLSGAEKIVFPKGWFANPENDKFIGLLPEWIRL